MKRIFLGILLSIILIFRVSAQFDGLFSNYMYNLCTVNPAYAGEQTLMQVSLMQRTQWAGFKNAPITSLLSVDMPFKIGKAQQGAGIQFLSDIFGLFNNQQVNLFYSYKFKIKENHLSAAVKAGFVNIICNAEEINYGDSEYHSKDDPAVPIGTQTGIAFDLGFGMQYLEKKWRVGLSVSHLNSPKISLGEKSKIRLKPFYQLHGGVDFALKNPNLALKADLLVATDLTVGIINPSLIMEIKDKYRAGIGIRLAENMKINEVALMFGMKLFEGFTMGYTFALPTNSVITKSYGTHEIYASYEFALVREKSKAYKSLRIL
jgi:type IX secretion system PorP/SprF family membrane protein